MARSAQLVDVPAASSRPTSTKHVGDNQQLSTRSIAFGLGLLSIAVALTHGLFGPNFVAEDWDSVRYAVTGGPWTATSPDIARARPGVGLAYGATFGVFGNHPLPIFLVLSAINVATGQALFRALIPLVAPRAAGAVVALWIFLPNHMQLEVWASASMITLSLCLAALAIARLGRNDLTSTDRVVVVLLALASSLFYEASMPLLALAMLAVPWVVRRQIDVPVLLGGAATQGLLAVWLMTNWHPSKSTQRFVKPMEFAEGLFGSSIVPRQFEIVVVALVLTSIAGVAWGSWARGWELGAAGRLIRLGVVVALVGLIPFARFYYNNTLVGDRVLYISAIGGSMILVGLGTLLLRVDRRAALAVGSTLFVLVTIQRWDESRAWNEAGNDAVALLAATQEQIPSPTGPIMIGSAIPFHNKTTAFRDNSLMNAAIQATYESSEVEGVLTLSRDTFLNHPPELRIDVAEVIDPAGTDDTLTWWKGEVGR